MTGNTARTAQHDLPAILVLCTMILTGALAGTSSAATIAGTIVDSLGRPAAGAMVEIFRKERIDTWAYEITTTTQGTFSMENVTDNQYAIKVTASGSPSQWYHPVGNTLFPQYFVNAGPAFNEMLTIVLKKAPRDNPPSSMLIVKVLDEFGTSTALLTNGTLINPSDNFFLDTMFNDPAPVLEWAIDSLMPGQYFVGGEASSYPFQFFGDTASTQYPSTLVDVGVSDTVFVKFRLRRTPMGDNRLTVLVTDEFNAPVSGVILSLFSMYPGGDPSRVQTTGTKIGTFFTGLPDNPNYYLRAESNTYPLQWYTVNGTATTAQEPFYLSPAAEDSIHLVMRKTPETFVDPNEPVAFIEGVVRADNAGVAEAVITVHSPDGASVEQAITDASGYFSMSSIPALEHYLTVEAQGYPIQYWTPSGMVPAQIPNTSFTPSPNDTFHVAMNLVRTFGTGSMLSIEPTQGADISPDKPNPTGEITITLGDADRVIYAVLRDSDGNWMGLETAASWTVSDKSLVSVVRSSYEPGAYTIVRQATQGRTTLTATSQSGQAASVSVVLLPYYYKTLRALRDSLSVTSLELSFEQTAVLHAQGKRSDNGQWEPTSVYWTFPASLMGEMKLIGPSPEIHVSSFVDATGEIALSAPNPQTQPFMIPVVLHGGINTGGLFTTLEVDLRNEDGTGFMDTVFLELENTDDHSRYIGTRSSDSRSNLFQFVNIPGGSFWLLAQASGYPSQYWAENQSSTVDHDQQIYLDPDHTNVTVFQLSHDPTGGEDDKNGEGTLLPLELTSGTGLPVTLTWGILSKLSSSAPVSAFELYRRGRDGSPVKLTAVNFDPKASTYTYIDKTAPDWAEYLVVATSSLGRFRSNPVLRDARMENSTSSSIPWLDARISHDGIVLEWGFGDNHVFADQDEAVIYRRKNNGPTEAISRQRAFDFRSNDWNFDPQSDEGATLTYFVEFIFSDGTRIKTGDKSLVLTATALAALPGNLQVGPQETYKTIASAVAAAEDFDEILVMPGVYRENVNFGGKLVSLRGEWVDGTPPVIDGSGGTAVTIPFSAKTSEDTWIHLGGFVIRNASIGIKTSVVMGIHNMYFKNLAKAVVVAPDSAALALALRTNPFVRSELHSSVWQCTFTGSGSQVAVEARGSKFVKTATTSETTSDLFTQFQDSWILPLPRIGSSAELNNILVVYSGTMTPAVLNLTSPYSKISLENSVFWPSVPSFDTSGIYLDPSVGSVDPHFTDTTWAFLPDTNLLLAYSQNGGYIGYDEWRKYANGNTTEASRPAEIRNVVARQFGIKTVAVRWDPSPADEKVSGYRVYRFVDSILYVNSQGYWDITVDYEQMDKVVPSFTTTRTFLIDSTIIPGTSYVYVVEGLGPSGEEGHGPQLPGTIPLSKLAVNTFITEIRPISGRWQMLGQWGSSSGEPIATTTASLFAWDSKREPDKLYSQYVPTDRLVPGRGCWVYPEMAFTMKAPAKAVSSLVANPSPTVPLDTGWNMITSPLPFSVKPTWMQSYTFWDWNAISQSYRVATELIPWRAYWVYTTSATNLSFATPTAKQIEASMTTELKKQEAFPGWQVQVSLVGDESSDPDNVLGVVVPSMAKQVNHYQPEPPQAFGSSSLFFEKPQGVSGISQRLASLFYTSELSLESPLEWKVGLSPSSAAMRIHFDGLETLPEDVNLYWVEEKRTVQLASNRDIALAPHADTRYGYVMAARSFSDVSRFSSAFSLQGVWPNPFMHTTTVAFTVPFRWHADGSLDNEARRDVTLQVFDASGRRVKTLLSGPVTTGAGQVVWDGTSKAGSPVPGGIYLLRLSGTDFSKTVRVFKLQ